MGASAHINHEGICIFIKFAWFMYAEISVFPESENTHSSTFIELVCHNQYKVFYKFCKPIQIRLLIISAVKPSRNLPPQIFKSFWFICDWIQNCVRKTYCTEIYSPSLSSKLDCYPHPYWMRLSIKGFSPGLKNMPLAYFCRHFVSAALFESRTTIKIVLFRIIWYF